MEGHCSTGPQWAVVPMEEEEEEEDVKHSIAHAKPSKERQPRFGFVHTGNRVVQAEWRGCPRLPSTLQP